MYTLVEKMCYYNWHTMEQKISLVLYLLKELITMFHKNASQEDLIETGTYYTGWNKSEKHQYSMLRGIYGI